MWLPLLMILMINDEIEKKLRAVAGETNNITLHYEPNQIFNFNYCSKVCVFIEDYFGLLYRTERPELTEQNEKISF